MDVVDGRQAKLAEAAGAVAVMALERIPADIKVCATSPHTSLHLPTPPHISRLHDSPRPYPTLSDPLRPFPTFSDLRAHPN